MITLSEFLDKAIEIPFKEKGRSWGGVDCWGMVVLAYKEVLGVKLPDHMNEYRSTRRLKELNKVINTERSMSWQKIKTPRPMDCVLIKFQGITSHIGLIVDENNNFIHIENKRMVSIDNVKTLLWQGAGYNNIEGFYRYGC